MAASAPEIVAQVIRVRIADIDVGERLRPIDPVWADALGNVIKVEGQKTPIDICKLPGQTGWRLVAGGHRHDGMRRAGFEFIDAIVGDANALERRAREVSENIWRKGLDPLDRAAFVAEFHELLKVKGGVDTASTPQQIAAGVRWAKVVEADADDACANMARAYGLADDVGDQIGLSRRSIYRDLALHRRLLPDVVAILRGTPTASNAGQLMALAKASDADQRSVAAMIVDGTASSASEGLAILNQKPVLSVDQKAWSAFFGSWSRMSTATRINALRELAEQGLPKGCSITFAGDPS